MSLTFHQRLGLRLVDCYSTEVELLFFKSLRPIQAAVGVEDAVLLFVREALKFGFEVTLFEKFLWSHYAP